MTTDQTPINDIAAGNITADHSIVAVGSDITIIVNGREYNRPFVGVPPKPINFVGREELLREIKAALFSGGNLALAALDGKPGAGKTALATILAWDKEVLEHFSGGTLWANLGPNPDVDTILLRWADALGVDASKETETAGRIAAVQIGLNGRTPLIVLDDVWHRQAASLLRQVGNPGTAYLLTTRDHIIALDSAPPAARFNIIEMTPEEAIILLIQLCPAAAFDEAALHRVARSVGYLPFALKLIGGYMADNITFAEEAQDVFAKMAGTRNWLDLADPDRCLTLEQVIELSVDALPDDAIAAFGDLAPFAPKPDSFTLTAAKAVTGSGASSIGVLVRRNILENLSTERITIHQTIASVAAQRCQDLNASREYHASYYLDLMNADPDDWRTIEPEWGQIQYAWKWLSITPNTEEFIPLYINAAETFHYKRGFWHDWLLWDKRGLELARKRGNTTDEESIMTRLAFQHLMLGDPVQSLAYSKQVLPMYQKQQNPLMEAVILMSIGAAYAALGDTQGALTYYQEAQAIQQQHDVASTAATIGAIAELYSNIGDAQQALNHYQQLLSITHQLHVNTGESIILSMIGKAYAANGDTQQAIDFYQQALSIQQEGGDLGTQAVTLTFMGAVLSEMNDHIQALSLYQQALTIFQQIGIRAGEAQSLNNLGTIYYALDNYDQALECFQQALTIHLEVKDLASEAGTRFNIAMIYRTKREYDAAINELEQVVRIDASIQSLDLESHRKEIKDTRERQQMVAEIAAEVAKEIVFSYAFSSVRQRSQPNNMTELSPDDAVSLLIEICPLANGYRAMLNEIARVVGYHPLALKLIGGYLASNISAEQHVIPIISALEQSKQWLALSQDNLEDNLEQILDFSFNALPDDAHRTAFLRFAAFEPGPASFTLDAAVAISESDTDTISILVTHGLLEKLPDTDRLTFHPNISTFGIQHCSALSNDNERHAHYYLDLMNADPEDWETIDPEWEQIQHAWEWLSNTSEGEGYVLPYIRAAHVFLSGNGHRFSHQTWHERGLIIAQRLGNRMDEAMLLHNMGELEYSFKRKQQALEYLQQALSIRQQINDQEGQAATLNSIGSVYYSLGDKQKALEYYQQTLPILKHLDDNEFKADILSDIGRFYYNLRENEQALEYYLQLLPLRRQLVDQKGEADTLSTIGDLYYFLGENEQSLAYYLQALPLHHQLGDQKGEANTLNDIGRFYYNLNENEPALEYYLQLLPLRRLLGDQKGEADVLIIIGNLYNFLGEMEQALEYYQQAIPLRRQLSDQKGEAATLRKVGELYHILGEQQQALENYLQALPLQRQLGDQEGEADTLQFIGVIYSARGDKQQATNYYLQEGSVRRQLKYQQSVIAILSNISNMYDALGDKQRSSDYVQQAPIIRKQFVDQQKPIEYLQQILLATQHVGDQEVEAFVRSSLAWLYLTMGDHVAITQLEQVIAIYTSRQHPNLDAAIAALNKTRSQLGDEWEYSQEIGSEWDNLIFRRESIPGLIPEYERMIIDMITDMVMIEEVKAVLADIQAAYTPQTQTPVIVEGIEETAHETPEQEAFRQYIEVEALRTLKELIEADKINEAKLSEIARHCLDFIETIQPVSFTYKRAVELCSIHRELYTLFQKIVAEYRSKYDPAEINNLGIAYYNDGEYDLAIADYNQALHLQPHDSNALFNRGLAYYNKGEYDLAIADLTDIIRLQPNDYDAYSNRGRAYYNKGEYYLAIADYNQALHLQPHDSNALFNRGLAYSVLHNYADAIKDYTRAIELEPGSDSYYKCRGDAYHELKQYSEALADHNRAIELEPDNAWFHNSRGSDYEGMKQHEEAIAEYQRAMKLDPGIAPTVFHNIGSSYTNWGKMDKALQYFQRSLELRPDHAGTIADFAAYYALCDDADNALAQLKRAIELDLDIRQVACENEDFRVLLHSNAAFAAAFHELVGNEDTPVL